MLCESARVLKRILKESLYRLLVSDVPEADKRAIIHELRVQLEEAEAEFDGHEGE